MNIAVEGAEIVAKRMDAGCGLYCSIIWVLMQSEKGHFMEALGDYFCTPSRQPPEKPKLELFCCC